MQNSPSNTARPPGREAPDVGGHTLPVSNIFEWEFEFYRFHADKAHNLSLEDRIIVIQTSSTYLEYWDTKERIEKMVDRCLALFGEDEGQQLAERRLREWRESSQMYASGKVVTDRKTLRWQFVLCVLGGAIAGAPALLAASSAAPAIVDASKPVFQLVTLAPVFQALL